ncbi:MAG: dockerin type I repeat-containing protein [Oscillospiraceae bacterium]|nr:dockerin type I repeat-containing protein [Oscillospiraceae bacterium]
MKKTLSLSLSMLLSIAITPISVFAQEARPEQVTLDGIEYTLEGSGDAYRVTGVTDTSIKTLVLPAKIEGLDVTCTDNVFFKCAQLQAFSVEEGSRYLYTDDGVLFMTDYPGVEQMLIAYPIGKEDAVYQIPVGTDVSATCPFNGCQNLTTIYLPDQEGLNIVGQLTTRCNNLEHVYGTMQTTRWGLILGGKIQEISFGGTCAPLQLRAMDYPFLDTLDLQEDMQIEQNERIQESDDQITQQIEYGIPTQLSPMFLCSGLNVTNLRIPQVISDTWMYWEYNRTADMTDAPYGVVISDCPNLETLTIPYGAVRDGVKITNCPKLSSIVVEERDDAKERIMEIRTQEGLPVYAYEKATYDGTLRIEGCPNVQKVENADAYERLLVQLNTPTFRYGDVNENGRLDILDVIFVNKHVMIGETLTETQKQAADVNQNGSVDEIDSLMILKEVVGITKDYTEI